MPRLFSPRLARLIAAALLLQWLSVFAPVAAMGAAIGMTSAGGPAALHLEICTPEGLRSIVLDGNTPDGTEPKSPACLVHCALMLAPQASLPPAPPLLPPRRQAGLPAPLSLVAAPAERPELYAFFLARAPPVA